MPTKGYRKGVHDDHIPLPRQIYTRVSEHDYRLIEDEAASRCITTSEFIRTLVIAHIDGQRPCLPHATGPQSEMIRHLCRLGNNLNQLTRLANVGNMSAILKDIADCLRNINAAVARLS